jgi:hypothetical protein
MAMASMPMVGVRAERQYPKWRQLEYNPDGSARYMPAGVRLVQKSLERQFSPEDIVACYADDVEKFAGPDTRVIAVSTHNPLGVTFAAGVYTSIFGSSREPINSVYSRRLFAKVKGNPHRAQFKVIVGGSGGWQIAQTDSFEELGVDCVVEGRSESEQCLDLFRKAVRGEQLPREINVSHPTSREGIRARQAHHLRSGGDDHRLWPPLQLLPDLNPQLDVPKENIMAAAGQRPPRQQADLLGDRDMFIWGQVRTSTPSFFPTGRLLDLYSGIVSTPGVEQHVLSHCTMAPFVTDPLLIKRLSEILLPKSPIHLPRVSHHPQAKVLSPLIGLETGSVRMAKKIMPGKGVPFPIEDWPSVVIEGLRIANENNWFPVMTLMVGNPDETDEDCMATLDLIYEIERRGLLRFSFPQFSRPPRHAYGEGEGVTKRAGSRRSSGRSS